MITLYADNFRGFKNTLLDFTQANFFVGENSSGKTSLLSLIYILADMNFWFNTQFSSELAEIDLGSIDELTDNDRPITIGLYLKATKNNKSSGYVARFKKRNNAFYLNDLFVAHNKTEVKLIFDQNWKYQVGDLLIKDELEIVKTWIRDIDQQPKNLVPLEQTPHKDSQNLSDILFPVLLSLRKQNRDLPDLFPFMLDVNVDWISPIRSKPKRIYEYRKSRRSSEGSHIPVVLNDLLSQNPTKALTKTNPVLASIDAFGKLGSMWEKIRVKKYGKAQNAPFEIDVQVSKKKRKISNVGYGVAQVLPIVTEIARNNGYFFLVQQPEVHLHPKAQAQLGSFFFEQSTKAKVSFVIETHSDYIIDRFRRLIAKNEADCKNVKIFFFEKKNSENTVTEIAVNAQGQYVNPPSSYRNFFVEESLDNLGV